MNVAFVLITRRCINLLSMINNARHFITKCIDVEYCLWLGIVQQGLRYSENDRCLVFGRLYISIYRLLDISKTKSIESKSVQNFHMQSGKLECFLLKPTACFSMLWYDMKILQTHQKCTCCNIPMTLSACQTTKCKDACCSRLGEKPSSISSF